MRVCGKLVRLLAGCGLATAALLFCGLPAHGQGASRIGGAGGSTGGSTMGSGGFGGGGGSGAGGSGGGSSLGSSNGSFSFAGGSASGQSFVGSATGNSFTGSSTGGFTGSSTGGFTGSNSFGGYSAGGNGGMSISGGVASSNFLASSFANPLAAGYPSASGTPTSTAFGQPLVNQLMTNPGKLVGSTSGSAGGFIGSSGSGGMIGSASMRGGMSGGLGGGAGYGSTTGTGQYGIFALPYAVAANQRYPVPPGTPTAPQPRVTTGPVVGPGVAPAPAKLTPLSAGMQTDLMGLIGRSDRVSAATRGGLTLGYDANGTVVLRGTVASPAEARALESLLRFAPGVSGVRSEMTLKGP